MDEIVAAYDDPIVRAYCRVRFLILRQRFLFEIGQYIPRTGVVLDVGCGFGLFALYFALRNPGVEIRGFDLNARRIEMARRAAGRLGVQNVRFEIADASRFEYRSPAAGAYMLDIVHHIPRDSVAGLLRTIAGNLVPGGCLVIKDVETSPRFKVAFTWLLDKLMDWRAPVDYWAPDDVQRLIESFGFEVRRHSMVDYLPYPHIIYIGTRLR